MSGTFTLILGPMFSGKTTELLRRIRREQIAGATTLLIKHGSDTRYTKDEKIIATHDGVSKELFKNTRVVSKKDTQFIFEEDVIGIDEGQFFPDLSANIAGWMKQGKRIFVSALNGDFNQKPFPGTSKLVSMASDIVFLKAVCMLCVVKPAQEAPYTVRTGSKSTQKILVGTSDIYKAVCTKCRETTLD